MTVHQSRKTVWRATRSIDAGSSESITAWIPAQAASRLVRDDGPEVRRYEQVGWPQRAMPIFSLSAS
jgi:hypothetical protein